MKKVNRIVCLFLLFFLWQGQVFAQAERHMVFTAYQDFISRLYVLEENGSVHQYHEYVNYRLQDMTVIDNEVYVSDAFIPCVYRVDIYTGDLELVVHDLSLYYFYGLAWDGNYFYMDEWDLNRYDMDGEKDGMADFDEEVMGAAFVDGLYWMLSDEGVIKCWDFAGWPDVVELPDQGFSPPSPDCRGLWYGGEYLWTAESIEGALGKIYRFDFEGEVIEQWTAPAFRGWAVCRVEAPVAVLDIVPENVELQVSPNPVTDFVEVGVEVEKPVPLKMQLFDLSGKMLGEKHFQAHPIGKQNIRWVFNKRPAPGVFILRVVAGNKEFRRKIIIQ